jgi:drug/metabolite transporter (DMT)-like permease
MFHKQGSLLTPQKKTVREGIWAALASALFLGFAPIFGKQAINLGSSPLAVVALRTGMAAALLLLLIALFRPAYLYIYPAGLLGCGLAGAINGLGSLFYYFALARLGVSVGQLLYSLYPVFLIIWFLIDRQPPGWLTYLRLGLSLFGVVLLTSARSIQIDWLGVLLMLVASCLYALHLPINQRVLYDIPAPTVTLYTLIAMSVVTVPFFLLFGRGALPTGAAWGPLLLLTLVTVLSRLTLFLGVKHLGGVQTALLGISELMVSIIVSHWWLNESLQPVQWAGAFLLCASIGLIAFEKIRSETHRSHSNLLKWLRLPETPPEIPWGPDQ